jgi:2-polyprenyl-3-methyl-5-hydroxy-6-metoxy-1,4-benzoquinol methylase
MRPPPQIEKRPMVPVPAPDDQQQVRGHTCPFCGSNGSLQQIGSGKYLWGGIVFGCRGCGGAYFSRQIADDTADDYWEGDLANQKIYDVPEVRAAFAKKFGRYLKLLDAGNGSAKNLLEVGCGSGIFLQEASRKGWNVVGLDISAQAVKLALKNCPTAKVICASVEHSGLPAGTFDVIALWDVIEHVPDPEGLLQTLRSLLVPGGQLIMETPDEGCLARRLIRFAHKATAGRVSLLRVLYYASHRWYFSCKAMTGVLERVGFEAPRFYREQTVKEFGDRKHSDYGSLLTRPQRLLREVAWWIGTVPWLQNKMVVVTRRAS